MFNLASNINPTTGIAYGYISAHCLDSELVDGLMMNGMDLSYNDFIHSLHQEELEESEESQRIELYECEEPTIEGCVDDVMYCSSWLGGALNFFIYCSPHTTEKARRASPCVPNVAILDCLDGEECGYNVPDDWRAVL